MTKPRKPTPRAKRFPLSLPVVTLVAFGLGVATTWLFLRGPGNSKPPAAIESFIPPSGALPSAAAQAPDVSQLPPAEAARTLANWNYDRQNWSHAIEHYEQALAQGADNPDVRTDLGNCYRFLDQPEKALEQYQIAQKQNPQHENSLFNQISLFSQLLHDQARAQAAARDFLARFPQSPQAETARRALAPSDLTSGGASPR